MSCLKRQKKKKVITFISVGAVV